MGTNLYAGSAFTSSAGNAQGRYKWDGNDWSTTAMRVYSSGALASGSVYALVASGNGLYVAGGFGEALNLNGDLVTVVNVGKWNGSSWSTLGSGLNSANALAVSESALYVGYSTRGFITTDGTLANGIAKWDGHSWSALGSGVFGTLRALAVSGTNVYVGGRFTSPDSSVITYMYKWNGTSWSAFGSGMDGDVLAMAVSGSDLYAGGIFFDGRSCDCQLHRQMERE